MSQKRKHSDAVGDETPKPTSFKKQRSFKPGNGHSKSKHAKRPSPAADEDHTRSINALKSRIRDLKRLLVHVENVPKHKMSAGARVERERELEAAEHELAEKLNDSREAEYRKKMIGKYHQVRFFDRQKATRILKRLTKELRSLEDESQRESLLSKTHNAEVDVNYAQYHPLMKPYSSLYPKSKNNDADADGPKGDVDMWRAIELAMRNDTLDRLRHSKEYTPAAPPQKKKATKEKKDATESKAKHAVQKHSSLTQGQDGEDGGAESDGGFFE